MADTEADVRAVLNWCEYDKSSSERVLSDGELQPDSTIRSYRIVQIEGNADRNSFFDYQKLFRVTLFLQFLLPA